MQTSKLTIGLRYCGGCNPRFDRVAATNNLKLISSNLEWFSLENKQKYDLIILIHGCATRCARTADLSSDIPYLSLSSWDELPQVADSILSLISKPPD